MAIVTKEAATKLLIKVENGQTPGGKTAYAQRPSDHERRSLRRGRRDRGTASERAQRHSPAEHRHAGRGINLAPCYFGRKGGNEP